MIKQINKLLKLVGFNLVRAKRKSVKWQKVPPYTPEELENAPLKCAVNQPGTVPLADYMGDSEWHNAPGPEGPTGSGVQKTHYVGDDCPGGHRDLLGPVGVAGALGPDDSALSRIEQPNSDNKIGGPTS